jgi:hypothetical protein
MTVEMNWEMFDKKLNECKDVTVDGNKCDVEGCLVGHYGYILKDNNHNAYRVLVGDDGLICFQSLDGAYYDETHQEYSYFEPIDFWYGTVGGAYDTEETFTDRVLGSIVMLVREFNYKYGSATVYEYTPEQYRKLVCEDDSVVDDETAKVFLTYEPECAYIGIEKTNGEYWVYGAHNDHQVSDEEEIVKILQSEHQAE